MRKYGKCAEIAARLINNKEVSDPITAWDKAALEVFPESESSRIKACPKNTFLGLCEEGIVKGVPAGNYTKSTDNKDYAITAVNLIKKKPTLGEDRQLLWEMVAGYEKQHNSQMDVVLSLWYNGLIA